MKSQLPTLDGGGGLGLTACDATDKQQQWIIHSTTGNVTTIGAATGDKGCWEINGCNYNPGAGIDTNFGCKAPPGKGVTDKCCSNMAFIINANRSITSSLSGLCFEASDSGGKLANCGSDKLQQFSIRGSPGAYQIVAGDGQCVLRRETSMSALEALEPGTITYDVVKELGWSKGAHVRDIWAKQDLGVQTSVRVSLEGGGDSKIFKLTEAK